jgi:hypothetical protein
MERYLRTPGSNLPLREISKMTRGLFTRTHETLDGVYVQ